MSAEGKFIEALRGGDAAAAVEATCAHLEAARAEVARRIAGTK